MVIGSFFCNRSVHRLAVETENRLKREHPISTQVETCDLEYAIRSKMKD